MKYGMARFVWGLLAVVLVLLGIGMAIPVTSDRKPDGAKANGTEVAIGILAGAIPVALGVGCLLRYRHWHREAIRMKRKPEQSAAPLPSAPQAGPPEGAR
jgi:hypothetical protein